MAVARFFPGPPQAPDRVEARKTMGPGLGENECLPAAGREAGEIDPVRVDRIPLDDLQIESVDHLERAGLAPTLTLGRRDLWRDQQELAEGGADVRRLIEVLGLVPGAVQPEHDGEGRLP